MSVHPIPEGYRTVTPYLAVRGAARLLDFLKQAFDAEEVARVAMPDGTVMNAEYRVGDSMVMIGEAQKDHPTRPAMLYMYVTDVDAAFARAVAAGGKTVLEPMDHFYGDRSGAVDDPAGNQWWIASRKETVTGEELARRTAQQRHG